jgi:hypothetical protein
VPEYTKLKFKTLILKIGLLSYKSANVSFIGTDNNIIPIKYIKSKITKKTLI